MQYDPRQSQPAPRPVEPTGFFTGIQIRPILMGVFVDVVASMALGALYYAHFVDPADGMSGAFGEEAVKYWSSSDGLVAALILGSLGTAIGGFYAAYKAGTLEMKHGALVGIGSIVLGLLTQSSSEESAFPEWFTALASAAAIPAGALGGFVAEMFKSVAAKASEPDGTPPKN